MSTFNILVAASPSFTDEQLFIQKLDHCLQNKTSIEISCLTQKVFTKIVTDYCKKNQYSITVHVRDFIMDGPQTTVILYNKLLETSDAVIIFWDNITTNEKRLIDKCIIPHIVFIYESLKQQLEKLKVEKTKRKKITVPLSKQSRERYLEAHKNWFKQEYPVSYNDGHYAPPKMPVINSGSRMDFFIVNFLIWSGHTATKVAVMQKIKGMYIASGAKKGTADITATVFGKSVKLETKHGSDKPSDEQLAMQVKERKAGGIYQFTNTIEEFFVWYDAIIN